MKITWLFGVAATCILTLSGCVVAPAPPPYPAVSATVQMAPPMPRSEYMGVAPVTGYVWISGYWNWIGVRYDWVPGRWAAPPRPGAVWVPHVWQREGNGWRSQGGHWDDDRRYDRRRGDRDDDGRREWRDRR